MTENKVSDGYSEVEMCDKVNCDLHVVRPGLFQCSCEDHNMIDKDFYDNLIWQIKDYAKENNGLFLGDFMNEIAATLESFNDQLDKARRVIKAEYDKALDFKAAAEADGTSDYDYWEGYVTAMDLADSLLMQD